MHFDAFSLLQQTILRIHHHNYSECNVRGFRFNTNLATTKLTLKVLRSFSKKIKFPPVGIELTTPTIHGLEGKLPIPLCHPDTC